jgi:DNA repair exonuclease SbcCD ATPase subunit
MKEPLKLSDSIKALKNKNPHIHSLRFPHYRNLKPDTELLFEFPITVLLGKNGTNKSSILHAIYGSVEGKSVGYFWFETKVDAIRETKNGRQQSVVHRYLGPKGELLECIKRIRSISSGKSCRDRPQMAQNGRRLGRLPRFIERIQLNYVGNEQLTKIIGRLLGLENYTDSLQMRFVFLP